jgi:hypothetical protein
VEKIPPWGAFSLGVDRDAEIEVLRQRIHAGETSLLPQLEALLIASPDANQEEDAILARLTVKTKRPYTLTPAAIAARQQNAQHSTGPTTPEGKAISSRNSWRHGLHARKRVMGLGKPCKSTCHKYPCSLVDDGDVTPGDDCLDKEYFLHSINAISRALQEGNLNDLKDIVSIQLSGTLQVIDELQSSILQYGVYMKSEKLDKEGKVIGYELKPNPSLLPLSNLLKAAGVTLPDFMITPKEVARVKTEEETGKSIVDIFRSAGAALQQAKAKTDAAS